MLLKPSIRRYLFKLYFCSSVKFHGFLYISPMVFYMLNHFIFLLLLWLLIHTHKKNKFCYIYVSYFDIWDSVCTQLYYVEIMLVLSSHFHCCYMLMRACNKTK